MLNIGEFARLAHVSPRMLRHYDQLGLLRPEHVDASTGYRSYSVRQLGRLQRLMALRDLGFGLEQIGPLLEKAPSIEQLRGMLELRRAQIERAVAEDQDRLRRVEAYLRSLEGKNAMSEPNIVLKKTQPLRIAKAAGSASGLTPENLRPVFMQLVPEVLEHVGRSQARPGIMVAYYDEPAEDGTVTVHAGFDIGAQDVPSTARVQSLELPVIEVASVVHHGSMNDVGPVYESLLRWIEDSGYKLAGYGRELYLEMSCNNDPELNTVELQIPIAR
ncbi:MerR family transcriptional regulator [Pendulispora albinea]|uniref:MerR family transcriptional regulator n=1 Tax=Pendulispora albinea TaxID=2741071 RepID=A0ABZ2LYI4_9BACT